MDDIAAADERFAYQADGVMVQNLTFNNGTLDLSLSGQYWLYLVNGTMAMNYYDTEWYPTVIMSMGRRVLFYCCG